MGIRNRERRKAKQRAREQRRHDRAAREKSQFGGDPQDAGLAIEGLAELVWSVLSNGAFAIGAGDLREAQRCVEWLADEGPRGGERADAPGAPPLPAAIGSDAFRNLIDLVAFDVLQDGITQAWRSGWQPQDVARQVDRWHGARPARLVIDMMAAELRGYAPATVDERWESQLRALGASVWWDNDAEYLTGWGERERQDRSTVIRDVLRALQILSGLPQLPQLCPRPGAARRGSLGSSTGRAGVSGVDQRMLTRVRALLAKAESTEFAEEADALTAKAQELMARYSIDYALLAASEGDRQEPVGIRIGIDNPYEAAKSSLLAAVAGANRCQAVWSTQLGFSTVLGYPGDLESVDILYTSLLVQATAAMMREGSRRDASGRSRTRSFRQSFLNAYAVRIGQRLRGATDEVSRAVAREAGADRLLPVLAARDDKVREAVTTIFPDIKYQRMSVSNAEGWASGTAAADLASLHTRGAVPSASS